MKKLISLLAVLLLSIQCIATVSSTSTKVTHSCDASATAFAFTFPIVESSDLIIILRTTSTGAETVLTETTHYSVSATNNDYANGGTVTTVATYPATQTLTILRDVPDTQGTDLDDSGVLRLESLEGALDRLTMLVQQNQEQLDRCIKIPRSDSTALTTELDDSIARASRYLSFDSSGNIEVPTGVSITEATVSNYVETFLDDADEATLKATVNLEIGTDVQAYDVQLADVAGLTPTDSYFIVGDGSNFITESGATVRTSLGLAIGTNVQAYDADLTTYAGITPSANIQTLLGSVDYAAARTNLSLTVGTDVQAYDAELAAVAGLTSASNKVPYFTGSETAGLLDFKDEDNMASDSATAVASQQSVKAYADNLSGFVLSSYDSNDSDGNPMAAAHAYLTQTPGLVIAIANLTDDTVKGYVGSTNDPAGAGDLVAEYFFSIVGEATYGTVPITFLVKNGEYFEVTLTGNATIQNIFWISFGTLSRPIDQD